jgi:hypothetical protein
MGNYRSTIENREILRILQKAGPLQDNILWQSHSLGKNIIPVHHFEIDFVSREIVVFFDSFKNRLNPELPLYVKLDYRGTVFKVSEFRMTKTTLHFGFPEEVKTLELRSIPRHVFNPHLEKHIALRPALHAMKEASSELHFRSIDISESGVGLLVSEHNRSFLKNNRILWLTRLQDQMLPSAILAEVVYLNTDSEGRSSNRRQKDLKVGLKLSEPFPSENYHRFIQ